MSTRRIPGWKSGILATVLLAGPVCADPVDERIATIIDEQARHLSVGHDTLDGPGGQWLLAEAAESPFVLLAESHLTRETPRLSAALLSALRPHGFGAFAIETGPIVTAHAQRLLSEGRGDELAGLLVDTPYTAAFIDYRPELALIEHAVESGYELWGLDQVFAGGARFALGQLLETAEDQTARSRAEAALSAAREGFQHFAQTGERSKGFLQSADEATFEALREAFADQPEALRIIDELAASSLVYRLYGRGANYESNYRRIQLMKRHLAERLHSANPETKVVMKFGNYHMGRGYSPMNQLDLGNAAAELAVLRGGDSLHVQVSALRQEDGEGAMQSLEGLMPYLDRFADHVPEGGEWVVFDLRPLRPVFHDRANREGREALSEMVWRFDVLMLTERFTRAEQLEGIPQPP
jgi:erythromycin esterase-like protein